VCFDQLGKLIESGSFQRIVMFNVMVIGQFYIPSFLTNMT
jgi:hypothetical protein